MHEEETPLEHVPLDIWYTEGIPLSESIQQALAADGWQVSFQNFESIEALETALEQGRPDAILCTDGEVQREGVKKHLREAGVSAQYKPEIAAAFDGVCTSYYPLGLGVYLTAVNVEAYGGRADNLTSLDTLDVRGEKHHENTGESFYAVESPALLIQSVMRASGSTMKAHIHDNVGDKSFTEAYNALADGVFTGGLDLEKNTVSALYDGQAVCGVFLSTELTGLVESFTFNPAPGLDDLPAAVCARMYGFAVTAEDETAFGELTMLLNALLEPERCARLCYGGGCIPAVEGCAAPAGGALSGVLATLYETDGWYFFDSDSAFSAVRDVFDAEFREAMKLLN